MAFADSERDTLNTLATSEAWLGAKAGGGTMDLNSWVWSTNARMCYRGFNSRSPRSSDTSELTTGRVWEWGAGFDVKNPGTTLPVVCEFRCKRSTAPRSIAVRNGGVDRRLEDQKDDPESWWNKIGQFLETDECPEDHVYDFSHYEGH